MKALINNRLRKENIPFLLLFLAYLVIFFSVKIANDDAALMGEYQNLTWANHWELILKDYYQWSSRVLVNFVIHYLLGKPTIIFTVINAFVGLALAKAFSKLFGYDTIFINIFIIGMILIYPIQYLGSAGWLVTFMTYFWPMAAGFVALVPIRKIQDGERFKWWQFLIYSISLIYAANEELELVVLLFVYSVFFIYFLLSKKNHPFMWVQLVLLVLSLVFTVTAPGNGNRSGSETFHWFPTYNMLDTVDKIDIGFFSTMQNVIFENHLFMLVITSIMFYIVYKKYTSIFLKGFATIPFVMVLCLGLLKNVILIFFSHINLLTGAIPQNGLFSITTNSLFSLAKYSLIALFAFCFMVTVFLCLEKLYPNLLAFSLLISGVASRIAMGFSPTIYASGFRTATPLYFSLIGIGILIYSYALNEKVITNKEAKLITITMLVISTLAGIFSLLLTHI